MLCSLEDLKIYKEYYENVLNGNIFSYEDELIDNLRSHKNKDDIYMKSYLLTLLSYSNSSTSYLKCRYLLQFMDDDYRVCDGVLTSFNDNYHHSWIENDSKVYDPLFVGVWPKDLFYSIMKPQVFNVVDPKTDEEYKRLKERTIEIEPDKRDFGYIDWYHYMKNNTINTRALVEPLRLKRFKNE